MPVGSKVELCRAACVLVDYGGWLPEYSAHLGGLYHVGLGSGLGLGTAGRLPHAGTVYPECIIAVSTTFTDHYKHNSTYVQWPPRQLVRMLVSERAHLATCGAPFAD